jgi:hypothetical protein
MIIGFIELVATNNYNTFTDLHSVDHYNGLFLPTADSGLQLILESVLTFDFRLSTRDSLTFPDGPPYVASVRATKETPHPTVFHCCVCTHCYGSVFTKMLPSMEASSCFTILAFSCHVDYIL